MRIIDLALKDLLQIVRDWRAAVFLVVMPVAFTLMFGFAFGGFGDGDSGDSRLPVGLLDQDNGALSPYLLSILENSKAVAIEVIEVDVDEAGEMVADSELAGVVIVPQGYSQQFLKGTPDQLDLITDTSSSAGNTVQGEVQAAAVRLNSAVKTAAISSEIYDQNTGFTDADQRQEFFDDTLQRTIQAWNTPPIRIATFQSTAISEDPDEEV